MAIRTPKIMSRFAVIATTMSLMVISHFRLIVGLRAGHNGDIFRGIFGLPGSPFPILPIIVKMTPESKPYRAILRRNCNDYLTS
jgi:hypothetical protein